MVSAFENSSPNKDLGNGLRSDHTFSAKADYRDYHHKVTTYLGRIVGEAVKIDPTVTARTFPVIPAESDAGIFKYIDTASSRSNIGEVNQKLEGLRIGIVGLGGTGAYILDLIAKTWVSEIHLFDHDTFSQHNAFRAPGAASIEQLQQELKKVSYLTEVYSNMRNGIVPHDDYLDEGHLHSLDGLNFVFLCLDQGEPKRHIVDYLTAAGIPFVEVGMGVLPYGESQLGGIVRVVMSTADNRNLSASHISYADGNGADNEYATNIQIAELNALNAALAVIQWKKYYGVYHDGSGEYRAGYSISTGLIVHR